MRWLKSFFSISPASLTLGTICVVVGLFVCGIPLLDLIELKTYDLRFVPRGHVPPSPAVVIAVIDEKSLNAEGRWPWPRSKIAALVDILSRDGARVIGFDIVFSEPDENSQLALIQQFSQKVEALAIKDPQLVDFIHESRKNADNDLALANAIKNSSATVVLGYFFHMSEAELGYRLEQSAIDQQLQRISASKYALIMSKAQDMGVVPFLRAYAPESNLEMFTAAATSSGYFSVKSDPDGVVRWMPLMIQGGEDLFPPLAVVCAWHYLGKPQLTVQVGRYGVEGIQMGPRFIPTDETGQLLINYLGPAQTFPHVSISDILSGKVARGTFTDKIVLVGATAMGAHDLRSTPLSPVYPGVEIETTVMDNILRQHFITRPHWAKSFDLLAIIVLGALIGIAVPRLSPLQGPWAAAGLFILYIFIACALFISVGAWLNVVYPLLVLVTNYTVITLYYYVTEHLEKGRMDEELKVARDIQMSMLPAKAPQIEGFAIAARCIPAREVGGDFYDFIEVPSDGTGERLGIIIGDVSGKAMSGALVMAASRSIFRILTETYTSVEQLMAIGNTLLKRDIKKGMFVALAYTVWDSQHKTLTLSNAGQTQPILCPSDGSKPVYVDTPGDKFPLGIVKKCHYEATQIPLQGGDVLVLYTDGVVEAMNAKGALYGFERFMAAIEAGRGLSANALLEKLMDDVSRYVGDAEPHDDLTIVVVQVE
jgi:CHASE2 domain-containing sensor protein